MCYNKIKSIRKLNIKVICGIYTNRDSKLSFDLSELHLE